MARDAQKTTHPVDEVLPLPKLSLYGYQHVLAFYAGAVVVPIILGNAIGLSREELVYLINADLLTCGVASIVQAWGFAIFTESLTGSVTSPGFWFKIQIALFLTSGAIFVMWLGEQITERGLGNGASLIIYFSIVERFWPGMIATFRFVSTGAIGLFSLAVLSFSSMESFPVISSLMAFL